MWWKSWVKVKGIWQLNAKHDSSLDPGLKKKSIKNMIGTGRDSLCKKKKDCYQS